MKSNILRWLEPIKLRLLPTGDFLLLFFNKKLSTEVIFLLVSFTTKITFGTAPVERNQKSPTCPEQSRRIGDFLVTSSISRDLLRVYRGGLPRACRGGRIKLKVIVILETRMFMRIKHLIVGPILTNCYLVSSEDKFKELAVIDPGGDTDDILDEIKKTEAKLKYIINTHYHFDHTLANEEIQEETGAEILIHEAEKDFIDFEVNKFLKEEDEIKIGNDFLRIIHTPGHTKGSICLLGDDFILTGDTLFKNGYGRTDLPGGSSEDLERSLEKLSKILKPGVIIYPGHGEIFKYK